jgi:hypothetical protein
MRLDVWGMPLGGWYFPKVKKSGKLVKIDGPMSNKENCFAAALRVRKEKGI